MEFIEKLKSLKACRPAMDWVQEGNKTWKEAYNTCNKGDWLLWLFERTNPDDVKLISLTKGHYANSLRHLIKDRRSLDIIDVAIAFGEGKMDEVLIKDGFTTITAANYANYIFATVQTSFRGEIRKATEKLTADICRKYLPIEIWNI